MNEHDIQHLLDNTAWFNQFFEDLGTLLEKIAQEIKKEFDFSYEGYYYEKSPSQPSIPEYYTMELSGKGKAFALQTYAVIEPSILGSKRFKAEPSFIVVKHSRPDLRLYLLDFGLRVIWDQRIEVTSTAKGIVTGKFTAGLSKGERFQAFQVPFDSYLSGKDVQRSIQREFVDVLTKLPKL
jgi:hypothetical protein